MVKNSENHSRANDSPSCSVCFSYYKDEILPMTRIVVNNWGIIHTEM